MSPRFRDTTKENRTLLSSTAIGAATLKRADLKTTFD